MTVLVVHRALKNGSAFVYEGLRNSGGVTNFKTLTTNQSTTTTVTNRLIPSKNFSTTQVTLESVSKLTTRAPLVTQQATSLQLILDIAYNGALATVSQATQTKLVRQPIKSLRTNQATVTSLVTQFISGSGHTTYQINLFTNQSTQTKIAKSIQQQKATIQTTTTTLTRQATAHNIFFSLFTNQVTTTSLSYKKNAGPAQNPRQFNTQQATTTALSLNVTRIFVPTGGGGGGSGGMAPEAGGGKPPKIAELDLFKTIDASLLKGVPLEQAVKQEKILSRVADLLQQTRTPISMPEDPYDEESDLSDIIEQVEKLF